MDTQTVWTPLLIKSSSCSWPCVAKRTLFWHWQFIQQDWAVIHHSWQVKPCAQSVYIHNYKAFNLPMGCEGSRTSALSTPIGGMLWLVRSMGYISSGNKSTVIGVLGVFVWEWSEGLRVRVHNSVWVDPLRTMFFSWRSATNWFVFLPFSRLGLTLVMQILQWHVFASVSPHGLFSSNFFSFSRVVMKSTQLLRVASYRHGQLGFASLRLGIYVIYFSLKRVLLI